MKKNDTPSIDINKRQKSQEINQILNNSWYNNPWVGGGLGWFYYLIS
jgi:hypothetical protein